MPCVKLFSTRSPPSFLHRNSLVPQEPAAQGHQAYPRGKVYLASDSKSSLSHGIHVFVACNPFMARWPLSITLPTTGVEAVILISSDRDTRSGIQLCLLPQQARASDPEVSRFSMDA